MLKFSVKVFGNSGELCCPATALIILSFFFFFFFSKSSISLGVRNKVKKLSFSAGNICYNA